MPAEPSTRSEAEKKRDELVVAAIAAMDARLGQDGTAQTWELALAAFNAIEQVQLDRILDGIGPREPWQSRSRMRDALMKVADGFWAVGTWIHERAEIAGWRAHRRQMGREVER